MVVRLLEISSGESKTVSESVWDCGSVESVVNGSVRLRIDETPGADAKESLTHTLSVSYDKGSQKPSSVTSSPVVVDGVSSAQLVKVVEDGGVSSSATTLAFVAAFLEDDTSFGGDLESLIKVSEKGERFVVVSFEWAPR